MVQPVAFISHHSSRVDLARQLAGVLDAEGVDAWVAPDKISPGEAFDQAIIKQIGESDVIVLLFCGQSDKSRHVKRELMLAEEQGKPVIPVRVENIVPEGLAYFLQDYQWVDWLGGRDTAIQRMVASIKRVAGIDDASGATPEAVAAAAPWPRPSAAPEQPVAPKANSRLLPAFGAVIAVALAVLIGILLWPDQEDTGNPAQAVAASPAEDSVQVTTIRAGNGASPRADDVVFVDYVGKLEDGTEFDRSPAEPGFPPAVADIIPDGIPMELGGVIPGFRDGMLRTREGGTYDIFIPAAEAYGDEPPPGSPIPPNANLNFQVVVHEVLTQEEFEQLTARVQAAMVQAQR